MRIPQSLVINFRMECDIYKNKICNIAHGLVVLFENMTLLHSVKIVSDCLLCSWHCFTYEEFSRKFNNRVLASNILHSLPLIAWFFCLAMLTPVRQSELKCLRDFFVQHQFFVPYRMECRILERENHAVLLSLSVLNWLSSIPEPPFFFFMKQETELQFHLPSPNMTIGRLWAFLR